MSAARQSAAAAWPAYDESVFPFRRMLVALAGSDTDRTLLGYAAMLQRLDKTAEISCLHVALEAPARELRQRLDVVLSETLPGRQCGIVTGDVLDSLLDAAANGGADLILVGHSFGRRRRPLARRLAMKAPCSVWMVPHEYPASIGRILVPIDFSRRSADTLVAATAVAEAAKLDECIALHVHFNEALVTFDEWDEMLAEDRYQAYGLFVAPINLHGVWAKPLFVDSSQVAQTIVRTAVEQQCDLIVMGTRGRSTSAAALLGSETDQCMMTASVPLLAVKHFGARLSLLQALRDERLRKRGNQRFV